ncbi:MAG TPA: TonB-dependent receptor [Pyrinomonadaceae bacterium]|nr:TonB-dependent receptor [Pyrinomonadaceae bacterium]
MKSKLSVIQSILLSVLLLLTFGIATIAQTVTGTIKGTVVDTNGGVIVGASVEVLNVETGLRRSLTTNEDGSYQATFLPLGLYSVAVNQSGFGIVTQENVTVRLNETVQVDITLDPSVRAEVIITDEPSPINTTNAEVKGTLTEREIEAKPTFNQGNFLSLAETFTGFQENPTSGQNNPTASSGSSINFNGTGTRGATFQINGVNNDDSSENQNRQGASLATIKEFQVLTNNFTAEFGRGYGAVVLVQTKQGTNSIRGEAYIYHNNSDLNAKSHFSTGLPKPVNRRNQFGFVTGFPALKNKLFGFVSADWKRESGALNYTRDVFLASERNPANWFATTPANNTPANRAFIQSVIDRFPADFVPNDSRSSRTFAGQVGFDRPLDDFSGRVDWNPYQSDTVSARYQYTRQIFANTDNIIGEATNQNNKQQNIGVTWTHLFSNETIGEFRYGLGLRTTLVGIKAGNDTPIIRFNGSPVAGSIIGNAGAFPINRYQTDNQFVYNLSTVFANRHFLKVGTDIRRSALDDFADNFSRGFYSFSATCGGTNYGTAYNAFLNGCVARFQKGFGPFFLENRLREYNFYVEDNWKVTPSLTLNLGYRYEYVAVPSEAENRINYGFSDDKDNHEPRVGFAWSPNFKEGILGRLFGETGQSSLRGGFGIYHGRLFQSVFSQPGATVRFNPPNAIFLTFLSRTNLADPTGGFVFTPGPQTTRHAEALIDPNLEMPFTQQISMSYERELPFESSIRFTFTNNRGIGIVRFNNGNLPVFSPDGVLVANHPNNAASVLYGTTLPANDPRRVDVRGQTIRLAADAQCAGTGLTGIPVTTLCPVAVPLGPNEFSVRVPRINERRPDGQFTTNTLVANGAWTYYSGLQIEYKKRLSQRLSMSAAYTWSKSIDTNSEASFVGAGDTNSNGPNARDSRAFSRFHTPHRFTLFAAYQSPFFNNRKDVVGQLLGGWNFSAVWRFAHGTPFTVINSSGFGDLNFDGFTEIRPALVDPSILGTRINNPNTSVQSLPREAFRAATVADFGCCILGRNTFYGDAVNNVDLSLYKTFLLPFGENLNHRISVRADFFNAFNKVRYSFPNPDLASVNFGRITGAAVGYSPRNIQISLRYIF